MKTYLNGLKWTTTLVASALLLTGCATTPNPDCSLPQTRNLSALMDSADAKLRAGCEHYFDSYLSQLLTAAEGDPDPANKRKFSDFLLGASDAGLLSSRQAKNAYNRYFNVKFVSLMGDYNNCSATCPRKKQVLDSMEQELSDKELGLLKVSNDAQSYYRADRLYKEAELVLEATCTACAAGQ